MSTSVLKESSSRSYVGSEQLLIRVFVLRVRKLEEGVRPAGQQRRDAAVRRGAVTVGQHPVGGTVVVGGLGGGTPAGRGRRRRGGETGPGPRGRVPSVRELLAERGGVLRLGGEGLGVLGEVTGRAVLDEAGERRVVLGRTGPKRGAQRRASRGRLCVV